MNTSDFLDVWTHVVDPMRAEVRIRPRSAAPGTEIHGRLMGPRCQFATTIEVAYPLRPVGSTGEFAAIIPEPSLWDPAKPFFYEGPVEWVGREGESIKAWPRVCFRTLKLGPKGLYLNNKLLQVRGQDLTAISAVPTENELLELRGQGFNALLTEAGQADVSELADRLGFLLVVRVKESFVTCGVQLPGIARQADGSFTLT